MQLINKGQANTLVFTLQELVTLATPYYLFEITNQQNETPIYFIGTDVSLYPNRVNKFVLTEGVNAPLSGNIICTDDGLYKYRIWEQTNATNLDPANITTLLEVGYIRVLTTRTAKTVYDNPTNQTIVYDAN